MSTTTAAQARRFSAQQFATLAGDIEYSAEDTYHTELAAMLHQAAATERDYARLQERDGEIRTELLRWAEALGQCLSLLKSPDVASSRSIEPDAPKA